MDRNLQAKVETAANQVPVCVGSDQPLRAVAALMWGHDIGSVVVEEAGRPVGVVTERDVVAQVAQGADVDQVTARHVMTPHVVSARLGDPLSDAALTMLEERIRHLPVLDEFGHVTAVLSVRDLMRPLLLDALASPSEAHAPAG